VEIPLQWMRILFSIPYSSWMCKCCSTWHIKFILKRLGETLNCLEVHLVFGLLVGHSLVATSTHDIDILRSPTWLSQEVPKLNLHLLETKWSILKNSVKTKIPLKPRIKINSFLLCICLQVLTWGRQAIQKYKDFETQGFFSLCSTLYPKSRPFKDNSISLRL